MRTANRRRFLSRECFVNRGVILAWAVGSMTVLVAAAPVSAEAFRVRLVNGNEFVSNYSPVVAPYDSDKMLIMTDVGNTIAVLKEDIAEVITDQQVRAFGKRIDTTTIEVGWSANDAPPPEQQTTPLSQTAQRRLAPLQQPVFNSPLVAEPNAGGGIPVSFANSGMVPMSPANAEPNQRRRNRNR